MSLKNVKDFLSRQLPYTLHWQTKRKFRRNRIVVSKINEQWEADLVDMSMYSHHNSGYKYILTVIFFRK